MTDLHQYFDLMFSRLLRLYRTHYNLECDGYLLPFDGFLFSPVGLSVQGDIEFFCFPRAGIEREFQAASNSA